jgi:hypothetical protein
VNLILVIQKVATPPPMEAEDSLLPQWAVAMISIGLLSLVCVVLFGIAVVSFIRNFETFNRELEFPPAGEQEEGRQEEVAHSTNR